jgi:hypothetical protein
MGLRWHTLVVDCHDADGLAAWWAEVLGWRRLPVGGEGVVIAPPEVADQFDAASPEGRGPGMIFVPVIAPKQVKNRLHVDLAPRADSTQRAEVDRLLGMGATAADIGQGSEVPWLVLADPEGNELCILPEGTP